MDPMHHGCPPTLPASNRTSRNPTARTRMMSVVVHGLLNVLVTTTFDHLHSQAQSRDALVSAIHTFLIHQPTPLRITLGNAQHLAPMSNATAAAAAFRTAMRIILGADMMSMRRSRQMDLMMLAPSQRNVRTNPLMMRPRLGQSGNLLPALHVRHRPAQACPKLPRGIVDTLAVNSSTLLVRCRMQSSMASRLEAPLHCPNVLAAATLVMMRSLSMVGVVRMRTGNWRQTITQR